MLDQETMTKLKQTRSLANITHEMIAQQTGLTRPLINKIEQGKLPLNSPAENLYIYALHAYIESTTNHESPLTQTYPANSNACNPNQTNRTAREKQELSTVRLTSLKILHTQDRTQLISFLTFANTLTKELQTEQKTAAKILIELKQLRFIKETYGQGYTYNIPS